MFKATIVKFSMKVQTWDSRRVWRGTRFAVSDSGT